MALNVRQKLAQLDPDNTDWQRGLSVSFERVGSIHQANGDNTAALKALQDSLAIRQKLVQLDPTNTQWQRDLSVSFYVLGGIYQASADKPAALKALQDSLDISKKLAELDPSNSQWQLDVAINCYEIAQLQPGKHDELLRDALAIFEKLQRENRLPEDKKVWFVATQQALNSDKP